MPKTTSSQAGSGEPPRFPETTPPVPYRGRDYDFVLQGLFEIQKSMGKLEQAVEHLTEQQKSQGQKLDSLSQKVYAAIAVTAFIGIVLTFFSKFTNDLLTHFLTK